MKRRRYFYEKDEYKKRKNRLEMRNEWEDLELKRENVEKKMLKKSKGREEWTRDVGFKPIS